MARDTLFEINSLDDAKAAWTLYFNRFYSPEIPESVDTTFDPKIQKFTPRLNRDAKNQSWSKSGDRLLHSDDFDDFLNGRTIIFPKNITLSEEKLISLMKQIENGNWDDDSFKHKEHIFYALWLFRQNKITRQQMTTILARDQIDESYPIENTFKILDDEGQFTEEAKEFLIPILKTSSYGGEFSDWHLERFRLLIQAAPKSEQIFFVSKADPRIVSSSEIQLGNLLKNKQAWHQVRYKNDCYHDFHLSFGAIEAHQIAINGINGAVANRAMIGVIDLNTIEQGVKSFYRPTAISIKTSGVNATTEKIHDFTFTPMPAVTAHDVFHSKLQSTIPPEFNMMMSHMRDILSQYTQNKWSKTMWDMIDREFLSFQNRAITIDSPEAGAKLFVEMFSSPQRYIKADNILLVIEDQLTDEGIGILWHMVNNKDVWKKLYKIDIESIGDPYKNHIENMKCFSSIIKDEDPKILNLKYRLFCSMQKSKADFQVINVLINDIKEKLIADKRLVFGKYTLDLKRSYSILDSRVKNITILKFKNFSGDNKDFSITERDVNCLLPALIEYKTDNEKINSVVSTLSSEFKSTFSNSQFSTKMLKKNDDFEKLTLYEKIQCLEICYDEILKSKKYTRRHSIVDNIFSFMKNPLTGSQRKHIQILKDEMYEIITTYINKDSIPREERETFLWIMKNRNSRLVSCNMDRFYFIEEEPDMRNTIESLTF